MVYEDTKGPSKEEISLLAITDAEVWKHGDQTGFETPVVHAVNKGCSVYGEKIILFRQLTRYHPAWGLQSQG